MAERPLYDTIGLQYARHRRPDPVIAAALREALGEARWVVNVGAGTGGYERTDRKVVAGEPSRMMIDQRPPELGPAIQAVVEALPLPTKAFEVAMAFLTVHHWSNPWSGLAEMRRVADRQVVLTFDPALHCSHWLTEYFPRIADIFRHAPAVDDVANAIAAREVWTIPLAHDTPDGMTIAYWRRPWAHLDPERRTGMSAPQQLDPRDLDVGLQRLETDLASGAWLDRYWNLMDIEMKDYGRRLVFN